VKKIGVRLGNWLLPDQAITLLEAPDIESTKGKRDLALLAILVACGLRRHEAVELNVSDLQQREDHWVWFSETQIGKKQPPGSLVDWSV
jgi:site-specific recombinase XerD